MGLSNCLEVLSQSGCESRRKHGGPVFPALSISDGDLVLTEVNVFYPQSQPLHQAHSRPIEKGQEEMVGPAEAGKDGSNLVSRQNDGKPAPSLRPDQVELANLSPENDRGDRHFISGRSWPWPRDRSPPRPRAGLPPAQTPHSR